MPHKNFSINAFFALKAFCQLIVKVSIYRIVRNIESRNIEG